MTKAKETFRVFVVRKRWWTAAACLCLAALLFGVVNHPAVVGASAAARQLPIYCVQRDQKLVAISFDAAWGNEDTQQLIDIMDKYKVKATFFVVGDWADKYPESVKALHDAGHEVMNHSNTHAHYPQLSTDEITADLNACNDKVEQITGVRPTLVRLPYGDYDDHSINAVRSIGMEPVQWDVEGSHTASSRWGRGDTEIFSKMESRSGRTSIRFRTGNFYYRNTDYMVLISFCTLWSTA
ncbi:MAG: polysaccharide deacetylase family protein [Oscillospiraceae bacterium]|jgi:hypothetical protein|nr:polysaccharide deacetylase family protein [Oscillospiraceae bacterium]